MTPVSVHVEINKISRVSPYRNTAPPSTRLTPLSALTLHLPLQFSHEPVMANRVTPLLYSAAGSLSDGPPLTHPAIQAGMAVGANEDSRVHLLEEWMDHLERQVNHPSSEQNAMKVQVETSVSTVSEPAKRCHRCCSKRHLVADCPKQ